MISVALRDPSQVAEARRRAVSLAELAGMGERDCDRLALVVTEAATNVLRHGGGGELVLSARQGPEGARVEVLALDTGPGMANVQECLQDGVSTANSQGTGLGAIQRLSDHLDIWSRPGCGTVLSCGVGAPHRLPGPAGDRVEVAALCLPKPGETVSGDAWELFPLDGGVMLLLCDGLGHGAGAHQAAATACAAFRTEKPGSPASALHRLHERLAPTRGAAAAVLKIDPQGRHLVFAGVGNVAGWLQDEAGTKRFLSQDGVVGHGTIRVREENVDWQGGLLAVFHSDGLSAKWCLDAYPGIASRPAATIAAALYRDFRRSRDDALVVVARVSNRLSSCWI